MRWLMETLAILYSWREDNTTDTFFVYSTLTTLSSVAAVDEIVDNEQNVEKRSAENSDGRNLLMAYLGNVGGYDREYRSAEDENKPGISSDFNLMD